MPKIPKKSSWVDYSVLDEMAARLRNAELWDNHLGDGITFLKQRIDLLERFAQFEGGKEYRNIRRPLETWEQCRKVLTMISASRFQTFSEIPAPVEACLQTAIMLDRWEQKGERVPSDIRGMDRGAIAIEWSKPVDSLIVDGVGVHP